MNVSLEFVMKSVGRAEVGDAELFARMAHGKFAYDFSNKLWYKWDRNYWVPDRLESVNLMIGNEVSDEYQAASDLAAAAEGEDQAAADLADRAGKLHYVGRKRRVLDEGKHSPEVALTGDEWDSNPYVLAVGNGIVDLKSGKLTDGDPDDYVRTHTDTVYDPQATAPRWEKFLVEVFDGDYSLINFLQRLLGYGITGEHSEHILPVLWGSEGRNGKDTMLDTIRCVMGNHAKPVSQSVLVGGGGDLNKATPHICSLQGLRLAWASETKDGARLNASQVKYITGGGEIVARPMYGHPLSFMPSHLVMLITNFRPHADSDDKALWSRVLLLPFTERFVDNPQGEHEHPRDSQLLGKLKSEASGILNWLIKGCMDWQKNGLQIPDSIRAATEEYRVEEDTLGIFIDEVCVVSEGVTIKASDLYFHYTNWAGRKVMSRTAFGRKITSRFEKKRKNDGNYYAGVGFRV